MPINSIRTLLIEDNPADAGLIRQALVDVPNATFEVEWVDRLHPGLARLATGEIDLILLDLILPDSHGISTFTTVHVCAPEVPIIVLTGLDDEGLALKAVREGAQDYLVKGQVGSRSLVRPMQVAVVRHRLHGERIEVLLTDELTGLHNRRGFLTLGEQQLRLADCTQTRSALIVAGVEGLDQINSRFGRPEGDRALREIAGLLQKTFGAALVIARPGGDEFAVMLENSGVHQAEDAVSRFQTELDARNARGDSAFPLAVSLGVSVYNPACPCSLADLVAQAASAACAHRRPSPGPRAAAGLAEPSGATLPGLSASPEGETPQYIGESEGMENGAKPGGCAHPGSTL